MLEVQQSLEVAIPIEAIKADSLMTISAPKSEQQHGEASQSPLPRLPPRLRGIHVKVMGPPTLSLQPPVLQQLQQFNEGMPVVSGGRMGCVIGGKVDYVVALDSGHEFTLEEG